jgi:hypothetical protein
MGGEWLAGEFSLFGIHFQNWMPLFVAIVLVAVVFSHRVNKR